MNLKNALTLAFGVALLGATTAVRASDAVLVKKSGTVTVTLPNGSQKELNQGDMIPEGSTVTTSADGSAYVEPVVGAVATLQGSTSVKVEKISVSQDSSGTVTKQEVLLDLTEGNLVSTLDPSKRAINDYKVHTPKGVAAARGTDFSASVVNGDTTIVATADSVSFSDSSTGVSMVVSAGMVCVTINGVPQAPVPLSAAISNPTYGSKVSSLVSSAVTAASNVIAGNLGGLSASAATTLLTQVVGTASAANPTAAASYASTAAGAIVASPVTSSVSTQAAADIAAAAATGAASTTGNASGAGAIAAAVAQTVISDTSAGTNASATIAGTVTQAVAASTNSSVETIAATVSASTNVSVANVQGAAATAASNTTINSQATQVNSNVSTVTTNVVTPINVSTVSPSS